MRKPAVVRKPEFCPLQPAWHSSHDLIRHRGTNWIRFRLTDESIRLEEGIGSALVLSQHRAVEAAKLLGLQPTAKDPRSESRWPSIRITLDAPFMKITESVERKLLISILVEVSAATRQLETALRTACLASANA